VQSLKKAILINGSNVPAEKQWEQKKDEERKRKKRKEERKQFINLFVR